MVWGFAEVISVMNLVRAPWKAGAEETWFPFFSCLLLCAKSGHLQFWHLLDFVGFPVPYNCWVNLFQPFSFPLSSYFLSLSGSACIPLPECSIANSLLRLLLLPPRCPSGVDTPDHGVHLLGLLESTLVTLLNLEIQDCKSSGLGKGHTWLLSV